MITKHDHNPVNDAMGNVEAFATMMKLQERVSDLAATDGEVK